MTLPLCPVDGFIPGSRGGENMVGMIFYNVIIDM
jgi:hypothetical protein